MDSSWGAESMSVVRNLFDEIFKNFQNEAVN